MSNIFRLFQEAKIEDSIDPASRTIIAVAEITGSNAQLERFPAKWVRFASRKRVKTKKESLRSDSIGTEKALVRNELHHRMSEAISTGELLTDTINQLETALEATVPLIGTIVEPEARATLRDEIGSARKELRAARRRTEYLKGVS